MLAQYSDTVRSAAATYGGQTMSAEDAAEDDLSQGRFGPSSTVLVVDDEPDIVEEVVETLEDEGFECISAGNAADALDLLRSRADVSIVVSDIRMPGMDGLEMAQEVVRLNEHGRDLSVIMVTGHAGMAEAIDALKIGVDDFLTKPISPDHLVHSVERSRELVKLRWHDRAFKVALESEVAERTSEVRSLVAQLEKRNEDLTLASRVKTEFLDMISHEMNTPMNAILGFSQLLQQDAVEAGNENMQQSVEEILKAGHRLHRKLQAILSMANANRSETDLHLETVDGQDLLVLVSDALRKHAEAKGVRIHAGVADGPIDMVADIGRLSQAIRYLADNAVRYSPEQGDVYIRMSKADPDAVTVAIRDDGPGMSVAQLAVALEPLQRGEDAVGDQDGGVGLGLPLARAFAEMHGGSMHVDTELGKGTTVTLTLPRYAKKNDASN